MATILIGSRAAKHWFPDFYREPKDWDYLTDEPHQDRNGVAPGEYHLCSENNGLMGIFQRSSSIADISTLYTLKLSHCFWNIHWGKTIKDIEFFQSKDAIFDRDLFDRLYSFWEEKYGKKPVNLYQDKTKFFDKSIKRIYDHDSIHETIKYYDQPLYKKILKDNHPILTDAAKFDSLSYEDKLLLVREEAYVVALERFIIPGLIEDNPIRAYRQALKKLITSMWKGEYALFIVLNLIPLKFPDLDYVNKFENNKDLLIPCN